MPEPIFTLIYASTPTHPLTNQELEELLHTARTKNLKLGITGMLVYAEDTFFQVLEGEKHAVEHLYATISVDSRHFNVVKLAAFEVQQRRYDDWTMKYRKIETA